MNKIFSLLVLALVMILSLSSTIKAEIEEVNAGCTKWIVGMSGFNCYNMAAGCQTSIDNFKAINQLTDSTCNAKVGVKYCCN